MKSFTEMQDFVCSLRKRAWHWEKGHGAGRKGHGTAPCYNRLGRNTVVLGFYCFKCYLGSISRCKTVFSPSIIPPQHAEQDQIDAKWLEKRLFSDVRVLYNIVNNLSIKETEFFFTHEHQNLYFHWWLPQLMIILLLVATAMIAANTAPPFCRRANYFNIK